MNNHFSNDTPKPCSRIFVSPHVEDFSRGFRDTQYQVDVAVQKMHRFNASRAPGIYYSLNFITYIKLSLPLVQKFQELPILTGNPDGSFMEINSFSFSKCFEGAITSSTLNNLENRKDFVRNIVNINNTNDEDI